jgi:hypothetical protein
MNMYAAACDQGTLLSMLCPIIMSAAFWGFVWDELSFAYAGPNREWPASIMCNISASCPEYARQDPEEYMDACAHDMWGVGYLLLRVLGNFAPWSFNATGSAEGTRAIICAFHEVWVCSFNLPRAAMLVWDRLHHLHAYLWCHILC